MRLHIRLINFVGLIVPRGLRADWRREWGNRIALPPTFCLLEWDRLIPPDAIPV